MDLSRIDIKLQKRSNAEAAQLGFVLARRYFSTLAIASALPMLPFYLLGCALIFLDYPVLASVLLWWMKPFYDRVILFNLSRLIFSEKRDFWQILASMRAAAKNGLWLNLTFFRFSPTRGVSLCLQVLEGLKGKDYSKRRNYILMTVGGGAAAIWLGLVLFEFFLSMNFVAIIDFNDERVSIWNYIFDYQRQEANAFLEWILFSCYAVALWLVEIFYVTSTFMLYINRRIELEGWDIEIAFKKIAEKYAGLLRKSFGFVILMASLLMTAVPNTGYAEAVVIDPEQEKTTLQQIIDNEEPPPYEIKGKWVLRAQDKPEAKESDWDFFNLDFSFMGILLKLAALLALIWVIYLVVSRRALWIGVFSRKAQAEQAKRPSVVMGMQVSKESLPNDIISEVKRLIQAGKLTEALSLLYRGTLSDLIYSYEIDIHESYTEGDCLRIARRKIAPAAYAYFAQLTKAWQTMVYAHQPLREDALIGLSAEWSSYFSSEKDHQRDAH